MKNIFKKNNISAYDAIGEAQKIAFAPFIFQAARAMRELGILEVLDQAGDKGVDAQQISEKLDLSVYGVETLLESGISSGIVDLSDDELFCLSKVGYFLLHDQMTRVNMDYNHYVCYQGMYYLDEAIKTGKPSGLKVFGDQWQSIYQALPHLPEQIQQKWYDFDHFYSDSAYMAVLPILFKNNPKTLLDIGTNIGKFAILSAQHNPDIEITMVDLEDQLQNAINNVEEAGLSNRVHGLAMDLLDDSNHFPKGISIYWLSQFLSCFGKDEIISILQRVADAMDENSAVYILENCWDRQQHEASAYSVINTSLYFTAIANGNSKMYHSKELLECIEAAGLAAEEIVDHLGLAHTLFICKKASK